MVGCEKGILGHNGRVGTGPKEFIDDRRSLLRVIPDNVRPKRILLFRVQHDTLYCPTVRNPVLKTIPWESIPRVPSYEDLIVFSLER